MYTLPSFAACCSRQIFISSLNSNLHEEEKFLGIEDKKWPLSRQQMAFHFCEGKFEFLWNLSILYKFTQKFVWSFRQRTIFLVSLISRLSWLVVIFIPICILNLSSTKTTVLFTALGNSNLISKRDNNYKHNVTSAMNNTEQAEFDHNIWIARLIYIPLWMPLKSLNALLIDIH